MEAIVNKHHYLNYHLVYVLVCVLFANLYIIDFIVWILILQLNIFVVFTPCASWIKNN